jgi:hypothetical protein
MFVKEVTVRGTRLDPLLAGTPPRLHRHDLVRAPQTDESPLVAVVLDLRCPVSGLTFLFLGSRYPNDWIIWVGAGIGFGAAMGPLIAGQARRLRPLIESMSAEEYDQVRRAAARGPVPADPRLRQEAARLASLRYEEMTRFRVRC